MKGSRTKAEWLDIFNKQRLSGISHAEFCRRHDIAKSSYAKAKHLYQSGLITSSFVAALPPEQIETDKGVSDPVAHQEDSQIAIQLCGATLSLPVSISPSWVATLLREMAR